MIVLATDPGLAAIGWALLDISGRRPRCIRAWTQRTPATEPLMNRRNATTGRINDISWTLTDAATNPAREQATVFAIEDQAPGQIAARKLGQTNANAAVARDVQHQLVGKASGLGLIVVQIAPRTWRARLGLSRATDAQIKAWVRRMVDGLPKVLSIHAAEAICIGVACGREVRR